MKIAHVALWTRDLEAAAAFWSKWFAAEVGPLYESRNRPGFASRFVKLPMGGGEIELMTGPWVGDAAGTEVQGWAHLAISMGSREAVDDAAERFSRAGLLVSAPRLTGDGYYEAVVRDLEGVPIEIIA
ncbi:VOC family protein [Beijerinckia sp. L45]|uniref:VOC family protein n=1 Tax=Beijerinckia sp. L45 TaxID=1641855 RepID=UPI00131BE527|nr:VOC family protein [Beijerinckia sp. L45]